jgi:hypothetical protein
MLVGIFPRQYFITDKIHQSTMHAVTNNTIYDYKNELMKAVGGKKPETVELPIAFVISNVMTSKGNIEQVGP